MALENGGDGRHFTNRSATRSAATKPERVSPKPSRTIHFARQIAGVPNQRRETGRHPRPDLLAVEISAPDSAWPVASHETRGHICRTSPE
jgi:hypothetical protein